MLINNIRKLVSLSEQDEHLIKTNFTSKPLLRKQFLLQQGDVCRHESFVTKGCFRSFYLDKEGNEHIIHFAVEDYWITDLEGLLDESPSAIYIEALERSEVLQIEKTNLDMLLSSSITFEKFFRILHQRAYIAQNNRILDNIGLDAKERYMKFAKKHPHLLHRVAQKYIASYLGITPVFLSQIQRTLAEN
jgi:CRP-like cAMP-binding protein